MQKVPRKQGKKDRKMSLVLLAAMGLLLLCAGAYLLLSRPADLPAPEKAEEIWIVDEEAENILGLLIAPGEGASYPLVRINEGMCLFGQEEMPLRDDVVEEMLEAAGHLKAVHVIGRPEEISARLSDFGLEEPSLRVALTLQENEMKEIFFGNSVPEAEEEMYYCLADGVVYTVLAAPCDVLFHDAEYLRAFDQPELQSDLIDRIELTGDKEMTLQYTPVGFLMEKPYQYPADKQKMNALLKKLDDMAFEAYLGTPEENDMAALGLEMPCLTVVLTQAESVISGITAEGESVSFTVPEKQYTLQIGNETGKSGVYVCWEGGVYKASNFLLGMWKELQTEEFLSRTPMDFQVEQLSSLTVQKNGVQTCYRVEMVEAVTENNEIAADEYGQTLYDARVYKNGMETDASAFLSWYLQLNSLAFSGKVQDGWEKSGEKLAEIVIDTDVLARSIAFYPYDALHAVMTVDGKGVYYLEKTALSLLENLP